MPVAQKKPLHTSDYVSDRVFDGVRKISKPKADQLRAAYQRRKDRASKKAENQKN